jgi:1-acyl-sn-glycerol-3-phosphate acyltransferase
LLYFIVFLLFALSISYVFPVKKYNSWLKSWLRYFFKILHIPVEVEGQNTINPEKTYIYMANHVSLFDIPLLGGFIPGFVRGVEAQRQHRWPLYGRVMGRLGNIPIERDNIHGSIRGMRKTVSIISEGTSIVILPEGHRTLDGQLRPFKKLPFYLAKQVDCPIIPVGLSGLFYLKSKNSWLIRPTTLKIKLGTAIYPSKIQKMTIDALRDKVRREIQHLIEMP